MEECCNASPLLKAAFRGEQFVCARLLDAGADCNERIQDKGEFCGFTPLMVAASKGHKETCRLLLNEGADWAMTGGEEVEDFALSCAARSGHLSTCELLLDRGVVMLHAYAGGPTHAPKGSDDALYAAAVEGHDRVCELLLEYDALFNKRLFDEVQARSHQGAL